MKVNQKYDPEVPLGNLKPNPANAREGDVGAIYESISANGFFGAVLAQSGTGTIIAGEHRWRAAREAGMETVPVIFIEANDAEALRILLADNRTSDAASWNNSILKDVLQTLQNLPGELTGTGFSDDDLDAIINELDTPLKLDEPKKPKEKQAKGHRPIYELVFDSDDELTDFKSRLQLLKNAYPHHDSVEKRLLEFMGEYLNGN